MCGIAGKIDFSDKAEPVSIEFLKNMVSTLRHRGPDEFGYYRDNNAGLVHARLSIIDITSGQQPMSNENNTLWIVFNGEIFNYLELRKILQNHNHKFKTKSDTEVILHAYEQWGLDCFTKFNGQWAIAMWDNQNKKLIFSRDHVGILPLFIKEENNTIWFASEIKAIFTDPEVKREIDIFALQQIFTFWTTITPYTTFSGIFEIKPGTTVVYSANGKKQEHIHWKLNFQDPSNTSTTKNKYSFKDAAKELEQKLLDATKLRMLRADVPVGSYLSGGLDSSVVAWMGRQTKSGTFQTFSIRFEDQQFDETRYQKMLVSMLNSNHEEILVKKRDISQVFQEVIYHTEKPILRAAPAPLFILSKLVHDSNFKAVVTGEGADEFLLGYDIFRETKIRQFMSNQPESRIRPLLLQRLYPYLTDSLFKAKGASFEFWKKNFTELNRIDYSHILRWDTTSKIINFLTDSIQMHLQDDLMELVRDILPENFLKLDPVIRAQILEIMILFSGYIISSQGDRMLMSHSVEGRFPFLDIDVINFLNHLPIDYKLIGLDEKIILKHIAKGKIPDEIINRKKQPYRAPDAASFIFDKPEDYVTEMFSEKILKDFAIFNPEKVSILYNKCLNKISNNPDGSQISNFENMSFVGILSTQLLYYMFIKNKPRYNNNINFTTKIDMVKENA